MARSVAMKYLSFIFFLPSDRFANRIALGSVDRIRCRSLTCSRLPRPSSCCTTAAIFSFGKAPRFQVNSSSQAATRISTSTCFSSIPKESYVVVDLLDQLPLLSSRSEPRTTNSIPFSISSPITSRAIFPLSRPTANFSCKRPSYAPNDTRILLTCR